MMVQIECNRDHVVFVFANRGRDMCMKPDVARKVVESLRAAAVHCETWVNAGGRPNLCKGEPRGANVQSWDGLINVRFASITDRESIPYQAARKLADEIESRIVEAENRMTILWGDSK